jgi:hypothetical protein
MAGQAICDADRAKGDRTMSDKTPGEDLITTWTEAQQKLMRSWLDTLQDVGGAQGATVWNQSIETWQTSVKQTLDAQLAWMREWTDAVTGAEGTPPEVRELAQQGQNMLQYWTDAQWKIWQSWFAAVKDAGLGPASAQGGESSQSQNPLQLWQDAGRQLLQAQSEWVRRWTSIAGGAAGQQTDR